uniref:Uncharacterized protein n=1 Tax=Pinctada fucata TaxID=50426 RepID=A0A194ALQ6_PINFU
MQTEQEMINDRTRYELSETARKINALPAHNGKIGSQSAMVSFSTYKRTTLQTTVKDERMFLRRYDLTMVEVTTIQRVFSRFQSMVRTTSSSAF